MWRFIWVALTIAVKAHPLSWGTLGENSEPEPGMVPGQGLLVLAWVPLASGHAILINRNECPSITLPLAACAGEAALWLNCARTAWRLSIRPVLGLALRRPPPASKKRFPFARA